MSSLSLSSGSMSSSLETADKKSSSVSMAPLETVVTGVVGSVSRPAEARILLLGAVTAEDIVASAAFRFRVVGGMVPVYVVGWELRPNATRSSAGNRGERRRYDSTSECDAVLPAVWQ